jgi:hypothetical protein
METPQEWHRVVVGRSGAVGKPMPQNYQTNVKVQYQQGSLDQCLFLCLASALHYMGMTKEGFNLASKASSAENLPGREGIKALLAYMNECAPCIATPTIYNVAHKKKKHTMEPTDLEIFNPYPTVVIPHGADGSISHAVCVVDDLIFDTTQPFALKCTIKSMGWICNCGPQSFEDVFAAYRFKRGNGCSTLVRELKHNWLESKATKK